jgi:hypothetical protein
MADSHNSPQSPSGAPRPAVHRDYGGWISGPSLGEPGAAPRRTMTTREKTAAALAVPCEVHQVPAGEPCPLVALEACMARRTAAFGAD